MNTYRSCISLALMIALTACNGSNGASSANAQSGPVVTAAPQPALENVAVSNSPVVTQGAPSAVTRAGAPARFDALLNSEKPLIANGGLSAAKVTEVIKTDRFDKLIEQLASEAAADPLAQDVTRLQRASLTQQLGPQVTLREFACGLSICAGSVALGANTAAYDRFADAYLSAPGSGSLLDYRVQLGGGQFEQRFVLSHDPAVNGVTFKGKAPTPSAPGR